MSGSLRTAMGMGGFSGEVVALGDIGRSEQRATEEFGNKDSTRR
jgi:hypothetical protein